MPLAAALRKAYPLRETDDQTFFPECELIRKNKMHKWPWCWLLPALSLGVLLALAPSIDITISAFFYTPKAGFYLGDHVLIQLLHQSVTWLTVIAVVPLLAVLLLSLIPRIHWCKRRRKAATYLLLVMVIGPGLIVNGVLKSHWDRARPRQIEYFGGERHFTPALLPSDQCEQNCSFPSGHAAVGFFFAAFGFVASRHRKRWVGAGVVLGTMLGFVRIVQGGHFLSDVVFSFCIVFVTAWIFHILLYRVEYMDSIGMNNAPAKRGWSRR